MQPCVIPSMYMPLAQEPALVAKLWFKLRSDTVAETRHQIASTTSP